jgi:hypothetical protein
MSDNAMVENIIVEADGIKATANLVGSSVQVVMDYFTSDSRKEGTVISVTTQFSLTTNRNSDYAIAIGPESATFDFILTIGIGKEKGPLVGGVKGRMAGSGAENLL